MENQIELFNHTTFMDGCWASYISKIDGQEVRMGYHHKGGKSYGYFEQPFDKFFLWIYPNPEYNPKKMEEYKKALPVFNEWLESIGIDLN